MRMTHMLILAGVATVALAIMPSTAAAGSCCAAPTETKKCASCPKCGCQECKCPKTATTNACTMATSAKAPDAK